MLFIIGIYFLDRDSDIAGGDLRFKRGFTLRERNVLYDNVKQIRPQAFNKFANEGFVPLGHFPTEEGRPLFSNSPAM